jgi:hypothetical protein
MIFHSHRRGNQETQCSLISFFVDPIFRITFFLFLTYLFILQILILLSPDISDPEFILWNQQIRESRFIFIYINLRNFSNYFANEQKTFPSIELQRSLTDQDCEGIIPILNFLIDHHNHPLSSIYIFSTGLIEFNFQAILLRNRILSAFENHHSIPTFGIIDEDPLNWNKTSLQFASSQIFDTSLPFEFNFSTVFIPRTFFFSVNLIRNLTISELTSFRDHLTKLRMSNGLCKTVILLYILKFFRN